MTTIPESKTTACIVDKYENRAHPILEVWESFSGWYWFITEIDPEDSDYLYGYVVGHENEWGSIYKPDLINLMPKVWKVPKMNWFSISHVTMVDTEKLENGV